MKLPSGIELPREKLEELCEIIIRDKFQLECTYEEAFEPIKQSLHEGVFDDIPILHFRDINFLHDALREPVIGCEGALTEILAAYFRAHVKPLDW